MLPEVGEFELGERLANEGRVQDHLSESFAVTTRRQHRGYEKPTNDGAAQLGCERSSPHGSDNAAVCLGS